MNNQTWEYTTKTIDFDGSINNDEHVSKVLNSYSSEGWELVCTEVIIGTSKTSFFTGNAKTATEGMIFIFKRKK